MIRKGVAAVIFCKVDDGIRYLLLKRKKNWIGWEWMKGGCKKGEDERACLTRELKEETGILAFKPTKTKFTHTFLYPETLEKDEGKWTGAKHRIYLVQTYDDYVGLDEDEHSDFEWLNEEDALKLLTWDDQKKVFKQIIKDYLKISAKKKKVSKN